MNELNNIVFLTSFLGGPHGTAKSARDFLRSLLANHDSVSVISPYQEQFPASLCNRSLAAPEWFKMPKSLCFPLEPWRYGEWVRNQKSFRRLRRLSSHDVVIVNGWASFEDWQYVKDLFLGVRVIVIRESPRHFSGPDRNLVPPDLLGGFSSFDHLIFVSERVCNEWRQYKEIETKTYSILPNCCEEEEILQYSALNRDEVRGQLGFKPEDFIVLCPGTIEHRKGQDLLLNLIHELQAQIPALRLLFVGNPATQWGKDWLSSIPSDFLGNAVVHLNSRSHIMDLLHAADVLAFPSRAEALPRTILEAMVMKTPVVASDVDGIPELIVDGVTGLLFHNNDKVGLLRAVLNLYGNPEFRKRLSSAGSERYWANFSRRHQLRRMSDVLQSISGQLSK